MCSYFVGLEREVARKATKVTRFCEIDGGRVFHRSPLFFADIATLPASLGPRLEWGLLSVDAGHQGPVLGPLCERTLLVLVTDVVSGRELVGLL